MVLVCVAPSPDLVAVTATELTGGFADTCTKLLTLYMLRMYVIIFVFFSFPGK